mmetsp:Transcript_45512/g.126311  ORF Transcript_45512/g.126311 Transcript_45512/m.126311 type:complete len:529 (-) Transcript_45512:534-2120(-)
MACAVAEQRRCDDVVVVNGAGPVGLMFSIALLDRYTQLGLPRPRLQVWDPNLTPWRELNIRLPFRIAALLPEQVQMELWEETVTSPRRLFVGEGNCSRSAENSRVHDPLNHPAGQYMAVVQVKQFQEAMIRYLRIRHPEQCSFNSGRCPPEVMGSAAAVMQTYGKSARAANPIVGNAVAQEKPLTGFEVACPHGLFVVFDRSDVARGEQDLNFRQFNERINGFNVFQSHRLSNRVQTYIWPEDTNNDTGLSVTPTTHEQLISSGHSFGLRALFQCVGALQGSEDWWWELSRRCRLQGENGSVPMESRCTLEWRSGHPGYRRSYARAGEKASSAAFEAWFDGVRYQISLNMFRMGIFGSRAEDFLGKVQFCYAKREPYYYNSVYGEVQGVPVIYLGDSAGSTDFKKGLSCGRGLFCASQLAFDTAEAVVLQAVATGAASLRKAFQESARLYQLRWNSPEMKAEWGNHFGGALGFGSFAPQVLAAAQLIGLTSAVSPPATAQAALALPCGCGPGYGVHPGLLRALALQAY